VATPARLATLAAAGVDIVSLANNHHYDMRTAGVAETPGHVATAGLTAIGEAEHEAPLRIETVHARGRKVALIAATTVRNGEQREGEPLLPHVDPRALRATLEPLVRDARDDHDVVIAMLHWGTEYEDAPARWQVDCARALVDAGADLVIGHHPHVLQAIERYRGGLIAYSLGNFLFDNTPEIPRLSGVLTVSIDGDRCLSARFDPAIIRRHPVHHVAATPGRSGRLPRERVRTLSAARPHRTAWRDDGDALHLDAACPPATAAP
jgi:poly-gamma-glutamate synthesis protein (capsule biosynthesis protein)